jgi:hypothetical protein
MLWNDAKPAQFRQQKKEKQEEKGPPYDPVRSSEPAAVFSAGVTAPGVTLAYRFQICERLV